MSLSDFIRAARAADLSDPHSQNGNGLLVVEDLLISIRRIVGEEVRAAMKEAAVENAASKQHVTEAHRECGFFKSVWNFARNIFSKPN